MTPINRTRLIGSFLQTICLPKFKSRVELESWQAKRVNRFLRSQLKCSAFYRRYASQPLEQLPIVDKSIMLKHFDMMNVAGISLDQATAVGLKGEASRNFSPSINGVTVGLSSGTSGSRGVFLTTEEESAKWAGVIIARALPSELMWRLLRGTTPIRIAFFLRANSNLYTTLDSKRIDFRFYDLFAGVSAHLQCLEFQDPDILVAPAHVLSALAVAVLDGRLSIKPRRVISVAEVLEPDDRVHIEQAFGGVVHQLYQCTEGFLGYTCEHGMIHLNEEFVHIEPEWLDKEQTRFVPIITDFTRTTQQMIRYRLNDVLRIRKTPCACGRVSLALDAVEGRCDDILWFASMASNSIAPLFPDMLRHALTTAYSEIPDYRIEQHAAELHIAVADHDPQSFRAIEVAICNLLSRHGMVAPTFKTVSFVPIEPCAKRRRIVCIKRPSSTTVLKAYTASDASYLKDTATTNE